MKRPGDFPRYVTLVLGLFATFAVGPGYSGNLREADANSRPSSQVAWTPDVLAMISKGDPARGRELASNCVACHGIDGVSPESVVPHLAGQRADYFFKQLRDYHNGDRLNPIMTPIAKSLSPRDAADLAAWYSRRSAPPATQDAPAYSMPRVIKKGDPSRFITACVSCHGLDGKGQEYGIPSLAGQQQSYLVESLRAFRLSTRSNDVYGRMRAIAGALSDSEIEAASYYFASRGKTPGGRAHLSKQ